MSTLIHDYELLVRHLEEMIDDGCQLVHGGNLIDWIDTKVPEVLDSIKKGQSKLGIPKLKPGDKLKNRISGQYMTVTEVDEETVCLTPQETPLKYPLAQILEVFEITENVK